MTIDLPTDGSAAVYLCRSAAATDRSPQTPLGALVRTCCPAHARAPSCRALSCPALVLCSSPRSTGTCAGGDGDLPAMLREVAKWGGEETGIAGSGGGEEETRPVERSPSYARSMACDWSEFLPAIEGSVTAYELCGAGAR